MQNYPSHSYLEFTPDFKQALEVMEKTDKNVFITGKAGTGKSTLLNYFKSNTKKKLVVLAPTGVAALNVQGQTIHSFFGFKPDITAQTVKKLKSDYPIYKKLAAIVIDEISMVRADLLDCVDKFLRLNGPKSDLPFGGVQMIFIGDLYQLPPVVTSKEAGIFTDPACRQAGLPTGQAGLYDGPYFFNAHVFANFSMEFIELGKIYRQKDDRFINVLNAIRNNSATSQHLDVLNARHEPNFSDKLADFYMYLTPTNAKAEEINERQLRKLSSKLLIYEGEITGNFETKSLPTSQDLKLKKGAQVMMLNNDMLGRWVNGSVGKIVGIEESEPSYAKASEGRQSEQRTKQKDRSSQFAEETKNDEDQEEDVIIVQLNNGEVVEVTPFTWEMFHFSYNKQARAIESETVGSFRQYPMKLAWAVTIHKSQGKTFPKVILDIDRGTFAHGQLYVALSRCTTLEGLILKQPILKRHIIMDWRVVKFVTRYQYAISESLLSLEDKMKLIKQAIKDDLDLEILYLKANDEKSRRVIKPYRVGKMSYNEVSYMGVEGYCYLRKEERVFRVDRMLEVKSL